MKKTWILIAVALCVCVIGAFALAACGDADTTKDNAPVETKRVIDNKKAIGDRDAFFAPAKNAENVNVMVMDMGRYATLLTETVANGIDRADYGSYKTYAYQEGADRYVLYDGDEKTYTVNAKDYEEHCLVWYNSFIAVLDEAHLESADYTFEEKEGTMTYSVKENNTVIYSISVTKVQDAITQIAIVGSDNNGNSSITAIMLSYNGSQLQKPDLSAYAVAG